MPKLPEPISLIDAALHNSDEYCPPIVTNDGNIPHVGHGRTLPLVDRWRPHYLDVSADAITDNHMRVYADSAEDVVRAIIAADNPEAAEHYSSLAAELENKLLDPPVNPVAEIGLPEDEIDLLLDEDADRTGIDELDDETQAAYEKYRAQVRDIESLQLAISDLLTGHADAFRVRAQQQVNAEAKESGLWSELSDSEREELEACADAGDAGRVPFGTPQPYEVTGIDGTTVESTRGVWTANVQLVCVRGDYAPYTPVPAPFSDATITGPDGELVAAPGEPNLSWIEVNTSEEYLDSLDRLGFVTIERHPFDAALPIMADVLAEKRDKDREVLRNEIAELSGN